MNDIFSVLLLGFVQGLTEFLPISSSMHLVLFDQFVWAHMPHLDVAVHLGSLLAVTIFFWREVWRLFSGLGDLVRGRYSTDSRLLFLLIMATIPVIVAGFYLDGAGWESLHDTAVIGAASLGFGILLWAAERWGAGQRKLEQWNMGGALAMGLAQILALIPGASRSGVTMTAALTLGYSKTEAARIALLMSMPVIAGAAALKAYQLVGSTDEHLMALVGWAVLSSFVASFLAIPAMLWILSRLGYLPFVLYRCALGVYLLLL